TIGEGELMAHDVPLGCAPDEYDDLILITLLISRLFHCAAKCRIIQQEYDTKTSKMFQSSHKMFQFVNLAELFSPQNGQGNTH
ncbi:hypothetical protein AAGK51_15345, partial [Klebsiella pneumoniae]